MPLVKLLENQEIVLEATAVLGLGRQHAKWSPGHTYFRKIPQITIKNPSHLASAQVCPTGTLQEKSGKVALTDVKTCILCMACVDVDAGKSVEVRPENNFLLKVESFGQLAPDEIVASAIESYNKQLKEFEQLLG
jgi:DNA-directed RNA polymerase subunit D